MSIILNVGLGPRGGGRPHLQGIAVNLLHATKWCAVRGLPLPRVHWPHADYEPTLVIELPARDGWEADVRGLCRVCDQESIAYVIPSTKQVGFVGSVPWEGFIAHKFVTPGGSMLSDTPSGRSLMSMGTAARQDIPRRDYGLKDAS